MDSSGQQQLEKMQDRRDQFRVSIRRQQKQQMLSLRRTAMLEEPIKTHKMVTESTKPELQQSLSRKLQQATTLQQIIDILRHMTTFSIASSNTVAVIYQLHVKIQESRSVNEYPVEVADLICRVLKQYLSHPDEIINQGLKLISKMVKNHHFNRLFKPLAAISNWGNGVGELDSTKDKVIDIFMVQLEDGQLPSALQLSILEDFLRQGPISSYLCYRITNYLNGRMGLRLLNNPKTNNQARMSLLSSLKIIALTQTPQAMNILCCQYIIEEVLELLSHTQCTNIIRLSISFLNSLIDNQKTVRKILNNVTMLPLMSQLLEREDDKIKQKVCFFLSNLAAFAGGGQAIILYQIVQKIVEVYQSSDNPSLKIEIAYTLLNMLITTDRSQILSLVHMQTHPIDILIDVLKQGRRPQGRWATTKLIKLAFTSLRQLVNNQDESVMNILAGRNIESLLNYLIMAEEQMVVAQAMEMLKIIGHSGMQEN